MERDRELLIGWLTAALAAILKHEADSVVCMHHPPFILPDFLDRRSCCELDHLEGMRLENA